MNRWNHRIKTGTPSNSNIAFAVPTAPTAGILVAQPMRRSDGTVSMWVGSNTDVDDSSAHSSICRERVVAASPWKLQVLAFGITIGKTVKWSPEHNRMLGIPPDIHEGSHELFISYIHASDREAVTRRSSAPRSNGWILRGSSARQGLTARFAGCQPWARLLRRTDGTSCPHDRCNSRHHRSVRFEEQLRAHQQQLQSALAAAELAREQAEAAGRAKDHWPSSVTSCGRR